MKNLMKKRISLMLAVLMLAGSAAACSNTTASETGADNTASEDASAVSASDAAEETAEEAEETVTAQSTLTVQDFGGRDYRMVSTNQDGREVDIIAEELTGSTLNDLVYNRNLIVSDLYNVKMTAEEMDYGAINTIIQKDTTAGDMTYDLYLTNYTANSIAQNGYCYNFYDLPYVDLTQEWWDQQEISDLTICGKLFMIIGDISPTELLTSECMLFNKVLFSNAGIEYPYDTVFEGKWTLDKLFEIADGLTTDTNGDGAITVNDDTFAITCWSDYPTAMYYGAGGDMSYVDADGKVVLNIDMDKSSAIYDKIYKCMITTESNYETAEHERSFKVFNDGRAYFCGITFQKIDTFLRDMEDDYGVLPNAKFDESQENYLTCVSGAGSMVVLPKSCIDPEFEGAMLEAMAAVSYDQITPSLINVIASTKNVRDKESGEIAQMIIRSRNFDTARMYDIRPEEYVEKNLQNKSTDISSYFAKSEKIWNKQIEKLNNAYAAIE